MGVYNVHGGHNFIVPGAKGLLDETTEDRKVTARVISALRAAGHTVYDCTDDSGRTQGQNLANIVAKCNAHPVDLNISNHLNAGGGTGVEVWCYNEKTKDIAAAICANVSATLGIPNRGVKYSKNLYVLRKTAGSAILVECCFVDSQNDANHWNADKCGDAIASAIAGKTVSGTTASGSVQASTPASKPTPVQNVLSYQIGKVYTLMADHLRVRTGPGTGYATKSRKQLTANAREHAYSNGTLKKGTRVTCKDVRKVGSDIWIKTPSGWMAAYYDGKKYIG